MPDHEAGSLVRIAYDAVRVAVIDGLEPGERVTVWPFTEKLRISPTPLEAHWRSSNARASSSPARTPATSWPSCPPTT
jgi:hypothetical protein